MVLTACTQKETLEESVEAVAVESQRIEAEQESAVEVDPFTQRLEEAEQLIAGGNTTDGLVELENLMTDYPEKSDMLVELFKDYSKPIVEEIIKEADAAVVTGDTDKAYELLNNAREDYVYLHEIIDNRMAYYSDYRQALLKHEIIDTTPFDYDAAYGPTTNSYAKEVYEDRHGNSTGDFVAFIVSQTNNDNRKPYVTYKTKGEYDHMSATLVCSGEIDEDKVFHVEVYGDDELICTTESFNSYSEPLTIDLDITGREYIKLVCIREDHNLSLLTEQPNMAITSLQLYNANPPEFEFP